MTALVPGSFDPPTLGHLSILKRACKMFKRVYFVGFYNEAKTYTYTEEQRLCMMKLISSELDGVFVRISNGMLADFAKKVGAGVIVKGVRDEKDRAYEEAMAKENHKRYPGAATIFLTAEEQYKDISSTRVREMLKNGEDIEPLVGKKVADYIKSIS